MLEPRKMLASRDNFGCVYKCGCGTIHVTVGPVDLKFTHESFLEACQMLRDALARLRPGLPETPSLKHLAIDGSQFHSN